MYMIRIRVSGLGGGKVAGRGHPGKNAGKLEEKCIKMITSRTQKLPSWDRVWGKRDKCRVVGRKGSDRLGGCPDNILVSLWPILQGGCQRET